MVKKKGLKKFDISNKLAYTLMVVLSIALLGISVYAFSSDPTAGTPSVMGHSLGEILWPTTCTSGQVLAVNTAGDAVCVTPVDSRFTVGTSGNERGKLCYNNPYSSCTTESAYCSKYTGTYISGTSCSGATQDLINAVCSAYCTGDLSVACDGSVSSCAGSQVYWTVGSAVCFPGQPEIWCACNAEGYYTQAKYIPPGTRCV